MLLGNHEYMMLNALDPISERDKHEQERTLQLWYRNGGFITHTYIKHIKKDVRRDIFDFLRKLPVNIKIEVNGKKYLLVHGSPLENYGWIFREYETKEKFGKDGSHLTLCRKDILSFSVTPQPSIFKTRAHWKYCIVIMRLGLIAVQVSGNHNLVVTL